MAQEQSKAVAKTEVLKIFYVPTKLGIFKSDCLALLCWL
jgi:hypothetical protein